MKKLLFATYDLNLGGIETSLVTLLQYLMHTKKYEITLVLEKKEGIFLDQLDSEIKIIEYTPSNHKCLPYRKLVNLLKRIKFLAKYRNKFDFSASYATYSLMSSFVARNASVNNALWGHADYMHLFGQDEEKVKQFFKQLTVEKFKHLIFVSKAACKSFVNIYPEMKERVIYLNNLIDGDKINKLKEETIEYSKENRYTFVNVGRHDERQKKLTRIIQASERLDKEGYSFKVILVGEGTETSLYKELVKEKKLESNIEFVGAKENPYPYMKYADCIILSSDYEGYPVVFLESFVLEKPILTTNISDAKEQIEGNYGVVVEKSMEAIYEGMKQFITQGYNIKEKFNIQEYNQEMIQKLENII